jgi:uncharacterized protein YaiI (UPF0178 family)
MGYGTGLSDSADRAAAKCITRGDLVRLEEVCRDFRLAKHTLAQVLNTVIRVEGVSLASAVVEHRLTRRSERDDPLLVSLFKLMSFSALLFLADERP